MIATRHLHRTRVLGAAALLLLVAAASTPARAADDAPRIVSLDSLLATYRLPEGTALKSTSVGQMSQQSVNLLQTRTGMRAHYHAQSDEVVYVLAGRGLLHMATSGALFTAKQLAATQPVRLKPGTVLLIPHGVAHSVDAQGDDPLVVMSVFSPAFHADDRIVLPE